MNPTNPTLADLFGNVDAVEGARLLGARFNGSLNFETMEMASRGEDVNPEVVVHTVSGKSFAGRLAVDDVNAPTVWVDRDAAGVSYSFEIAKRHIEAIERVTPFNEDDGAAVVDEAEHPVHQVLKQVVSSVRRGVADGQ